MYKRHPVAKKAMFKLHYNIPESYIGIHGRIYDVSDFKHPGGNLFIEFAKGQDCTVLFETHHLNIEKASEYLKQLPEIGTYTPIIDFDFQNYRKLTTELLPKLKKKIPLSTILFRILVLFLVVITHLLLCMYSNWSIILIVLSAILNTIAGGIAHNSLHKLGVESIFLDWNGLSTSEWIIEHVTSHHMYTNTEYDHDCISMEPFIAWLPNRKGCARITGMHFLFAIAEIVVSINGLFVHRFRWLDARFPLYLRIIPLIFPLRCISLMFCHGCVYGTVYFVLQCSIASYIFSFLAHLNHSTILTTVPMNHDFLLHQLNTTIDIIKLYNLNLGLDRQSMHHLFPTVDHSLLDENIRLYIINFLNSSYKLPRYSIKYLYAGLKTIIENQSVTKNVRHKSL